MIEIQKLRKGQRILRFYTEGETSVIDMIVTAAAYDSVLGWHAHLDWSDDDYSTTIFEKDQHKYEYGRRRWDRKPKTALEIKAEMKVKEQSDIDKLHPSWNDPDRGWI